MALLDPSYNGSKPTAILEIIGVLTLLIQKNCYDERLSWMLCNSKAFLIYD
jgi:hypothetical protein